ncbi:hypothetical protein AAG906_023806 [Vitis piasezkii]
MANTRKHTALLVIDMQKDFVEEDGLTRVDGGKAIVPSVIKAVEVARELGIFVVWVVREHDPLGRDVELFRRNFYGPGKIGPLSEGSVGAELVDGLVIKEGDYKLVKTRFSAFFATHLHSFLQSNGINSVVIVGVQTPNCIRQTVFDAVALDYQSVTVIVDATAAATPDIHFGTLHYEPFVELFSHQGCTISRISLFFSFEKTLVWNKFFDLISRIESVGTSGNGNGDYRLHIKNGASPMLDLNLAAKSDFSITEIAFIPSPRKSFPSKQTRRVNSVPSLPQQETLVCRELLAMAETRKHTALLVVDMQKDFLDEDRPISLEGGKAIIPSVIKAVEVARELGILVVWVVREHDPQGRDVEVFRRNFYGPGKLSPATKGSEGAELVDGLVMKEGDYKLVKTRFSAFFATHLHSLLQSNGINSVVVVGK